MSGHFRFMDRKPHTLRADELRRRFMQEVLQDNAEFISEEQEKNAALKLKKQSGKLLSDRSKKNEKAGELGQKLELAAVKYLRFQDIGRITKSKEKLNQRGSRKSKSSRKSVNLYNRVIYGRLANIAGRLQYGFTEEVIKQMEESTKFRRVD